MARVLKQLLSNNHPLFLMNIARLERAAGSPGIDTRLIGEIIEKAHRAIRTLGLDSSNITSKELYHALNSGVISGSSEIALKGCEYVLVNVGDGPVSLNYQDVVENSHHQLPFEQRMLDHGQRHLRLEIIKRYAEYERLHPEVVLSLAKEVGLHDDRDADHTYGHESLHETENDSPRILAIGDIVTDAFIKLREDQARIDTDPDGSKRLSMEFGSKPPYESVDIIQAVGNSANAAVAFSRLGVSAGLMAFIGDDQPGRDSLQYLAQERIDTSTVSVQVGMKSNYHYALRYGADRTILIKYEPYDYRWQQPGYVPEWIYLSMLSDASWDLHESLVRYLGEHQDVKLAFQPGTFHFEWGVERLGEIYRRSELVCMNREEAVRVTGQSHDSIEDLLAGMHDLGPRIAILTDGSSGAYASDGERRYKIPNYPDPAPPLDRTGAGDAFSSTIIAALAGGESFETALLWAPINSMSVVQRLGAQAGLLDTEQIEQFLKDAPETYMLEEF